ncbi:MAG: hypothetical protein MUP40_05570 [Actinobacteria bacterium]|nr:hypothetical protein [Actinomycetota bacterium]
MAVARTVLWRVVAPTVEDRVAAGMDTGRAAGTEEGLPAQALVGGTVARLLQMRQDKGCRNEGIVLPTGAGNRDM